MFTGNVEPFCVPGTHSGQLLHHLRVAEAGRPRGVTSVPILYTCFRSTTTENTNIARAYKNHIKHTSNMNRPDKPQLIITLVNSIGANKVKRQTSNISKPLIPDSCSLDSSFSSAYFHHRMLTFIAYKNGVKLSLKKSCNYKKGGAPLPIELTIKRGEDSYTASALSSDRKSRSILSVTLSSLG